MEWKISDIHPECVERFEYNLHRIDGCLGYIPEGKDTYSKFLRVRVKNGEYWEWRTILATTLYNLVYGHPAGKSACGTLGCVELSHRIKEQRKIKRLNREASKLKEVAPSEKDIFWDNVQKRGNDEHWIWTEQHKSWVLGGERMSVVRAAYTASLGTIPKGYKVIRACGHPNCVNPNHLELR